MTSYIFLWLLHLTFINSSSGKYYQNSVYGLPELARDILEKIKAATGQPIDTTRFIPILAASSKGYEVLEYQPYTKTSTFHKASNNKKIDGGSVHSQKGEKGNTREKNHFYEFGESGEDGQDFLKHEYGDNSGKQHKFNEERFLKKNHHKATGGKKGGKSKKGRKHGKFRVEKGFRDIYRRDEEKKSDYFWNNQHEEGKWVEYGLRNRKVEKSHDKGDEGKQKKEKTQESAYEKKEKTQESAHEKKDTKCSNCKAR